MAKPVSFDLTGKVVIVTGAGRGIGKAIAEVCAQFGADLALGSRTVEECEATAAECRNLSRRAEARPLDVADLASILSFLESTLEAFGRVDVVVNNAGFNIAKPALDFSEEEFDQIDDVNFKGTFFMSTTAARSMIERGIEGRIINITSQVAVVGGPQRTPYTGAKGAVTQITRSLAAEWAPHKITVNAVAPTFTKTPLLAQVITNNPDFSKNLEKVPLGRAAEPEEIAAAVVYLASDAARMVTGQTLCVDGGWTAV